MAKGTTPAVKQVTLIEAQCSTIPEEVEREVADIWRFLEYGNDHYYWSTSISDIEEMLWDWESDKPGTIEVERWVNKPADAPSYDGYGWQMFKTDLPHLRRWLEEQGFERDQELLIHWWW